MAEKIIRDPVHDVIAFRLDDPIDALLFRLINAEEFQRLRRIRQLGMAHLAYPGADHSRYSHSIGVMETARKMLARLSDDFAITDEECTVSLVAALLHDLGHGPFSHVFERVSGVHHEDLTRQTIADESSEVFQLLKAHDAKLPELVLNFMSGKTGRKFLYDIFSSQLDADRFDYLLRDNLNTGTRYGGYDLHWLLHAITVDDKSQRLVIGYKGVSAVEQYLQSRFHMYRNVYFHKVVRSAEGMVKLALQRARRLAVQDRLPWPPRENAVTKALLGQKLTNEEFVDLDDVAIQHCFKQWTKCEDVTLAMLCKGLLFRKLYKSIDLTHEDPKKAAKKVANVFEAISAAGGEVAYEFFYDDPSDTPYETDGSDEILVARRDGSLMRIVDISPITQALKVELQFRRIHFAANWKELVTKTLSAESF